MTDNNDTPSSGPTRRRRPFTKVLALPLLIILLSAFIGGLNFRWRTELRSIHEFILTTNNEYYEHDEEDEADDIIRKSYEKTYAHILPCDTDAPSGRICMNKTVQYFNPSNSNDIITDSSSSDANIMHNIPSIPWWFQTLLRDITQNGAYGSWHEFSTTTPPLQFCSIEKVGTTEWRRVFCKINADECAPNPLQKCGKKKCAWQTKKEMPEDAPWAVFLRDPLERLLSGYLDKCYSNVTRKMEHHCEPNVIFNPKPNLMDRRGKEYPSLVDHLLDKDKQMFAAYVDVLPLKVCVFRRYGTISDMLSIRFVVLNDVTSCHLSQVEFAFHTPSNIM